MNKFEVGDRVIISENIYNFTFAFLTKGEKNERIGISGEFKQGIRGD